MTLSRARSTRVVPVGAAVDIGAHSVHLLVAEVHGHRLVPLLDESSTLSLGAVVDQRGELGFEAGTRLVDTLAGYVDRARELGAGAISFVATDALRRAADTAAVSETIAARTGIEVQVLRHEEEALLSLLGVQAGHPVPREMAVVDVGGGSTEVLVVGPGRDPVAVGLPLGAARLSRTMIAGDPPTVAEIDALLRETRAVAAAVPEGTPVDLVAVGGTASNLLRVGPPLVRRLLTVGRITRTLETLTTMPAEAIAARYAIKLTRARVLPGGAAILLAVAERYERDQVRVATWGLREGLILAATRGGIGWRADLAGLAQGWSS